MRNMTKGFVCVPASNQSGKIRDELVKFPCTIFDNTVSFVMKPLNDAEYDIVMTFEIVPAEIERLIGYVVDHVPVGKAWIQFENGSKVFVRAYENTALVYAMN